MNVNAASSILADRMQLQREQLNMALMKNQMQAEQAMAQMLMDAAKNVEQISGSSTGAEGSIVDRYV